MTTVLALESGRSQDVFSMSTSNMDSLSYVDPLSDKEKDLAEALIDDEMKRSSKRPADYLRGMEPMPSLKFPEHPILQHEFTRIAERRPMATMDVSRYELPEPSLQQRNDPSAWRSATNNAAAQLEQQLNRIVNLELALKHAPDVWRAHNARTTALIKQLESDLEASAAAALQANQRRKLRQEAAGRDLARKEGELAALTSKNVEMEVACQLVEDKIRRLESAIEQHASAAGAAPGGEAAAPTLVQ